MKNVKTLKGKTDVFLNKSKVKSENQKVKLHTKGNKGVLGNQHWYY